MLLKCIFVGIGGFLGSVIRYLISAMPFKTECRFPWPTFIVNVLGAVLIGFIIAYAESKGLKEDTLLLLKVGLCGGITTFSTFSFNILC